MKYRSEIDGLRCLAVVPVVLFHAGLPLFPGGFAGVDVFFVISGFLITTIIATELRQGTFSILTFYERRARRILPALTVVVLACVPFAFAWMPPELFRDFGQSVLAVSLFLSNVLFWRENNYFAAAAEEKPLLHTWSLAVEEQFYILFPVILIIVWRWRPSLVIHTVALVGISSFIWCVYSTNIFPEQAFYLLPARAWELFVGALCALWVLRNPTAPNEVLSLAGIFMVVLSIVFLNKELPFPSAYALLPVAGTALVLLFGQAGTIAAKILAWKPFVAIGLISYSLYLWHQPLMAFARIRSINPPEATIMIAMAVLSVILAWFSWRFVERPFRKRGGVFQARSSLLAASVVVIFICASLGGAMQSRFFDTIRFDAETLNQVRSFPSGGANNRCYGVPSVERIAAGEMCRIGDLEAPIAFYLIGDSHSSALTPVLSRELADQGKAAYVITSGWCAPLTRFGTATTRKNPECRSRIEAALANIEKTRLPVVMFAEWANYTSGGRWGDSGPSAFTFGDNGNSRIANNPSQMAQALQATLDRLSEIGIPIVFAKSTPEYQFHVPHKLAMLLHLELDPARLDLPIKDYERRNEEVTRIFSEVDWPNNLIKIESGELYCDSDKCRPVDDSNRPLFADSNHLNNLGSERLVSEIIEALEQFERSSDPQS